MDRMGSRPTQESRMPAIPRISPLSTLPSETATIIDRPNRASIQYSGALKEMVKLAMGVENRMRQKVEKMPPMKE